MVFSPLIIMCSLVLFGMCVDLSFSPSFIYSVSRVIGTVKIWVSFRNANNWYKLETLEAPKKKNRSGGQRTLDMLSR